MGAGVSKHRRKRAARVRKHGGFEVLRVHDGAISVAPRHRGLRKQQFREGQRFVELTLACGVDAKAFEPKQFVVGIDFGFDDATAFYELRHGLYSQARCTPRNPPLINLLEPI